jgi:hypothetical protein
VVVVVLLLLSLAADDSHRPRSSVADVRACTLPSHSLSRYVRKIMDYYDQIAAEYGVY